MIHLLHREIFPSFLIHHRSRLFFERGHITNKLFSSAWPCNPWRLNIHQRCDTCLLAAISNFTPAELAQTMHDSKVQLRYHSVRERSDDVARAWKTIIDHQDVANTIPQYVTERAYSE